MYFEGKLGDCKVEWYDRGEEDGAYRYCLCSAMPLWWHGARSALCAGLACEEVRLQGSALRRRSAHIRLPEAIRRFRLATLLKEALLHEMGHAFLFLTGRSEPGPGATEHGPLFVRLVTKLNSDALTFDAYRPREGYAVKASDDAPLDAERRGKVRLAALRDALESHHMRVLHIMARYTRAAKHASEMERCLGEIALNVLLHEAAREEVLPYDFAPLTVWVASRRVRLNVSQEAADSVGDLCDAELVRQVRLVSRDARPTVAFQISPEGTAAIAAAPLDKFEVQDVERVITAVKLAGEYRGAVMRPIHRGGSEFILRDGASKLSFDSRIADVERCLYVLTPVLPAFAFAPERPLADHSDRARDCAEGHRGRAGVEPLAALAATSKNVLRLRGCTITLAEWMPFGCNLLLDMGVRLGARDTVSGGCVTQKRDEDPTGMNLTTNADHAEISARPCPLASAPARCALCPDSYRRGALPRSRLTATALETSSTSPLCRWHLKPTRGRWAPRRFRTLASGTTATAW